MNLFPDYKSKEEIEAERLLAIKIAKIEKIMKKAKRRESICEKWLKKQTGNITRGVFILFFTKKFRYKSFEKSLFDAETLFLILFEKYGKIATVNYGGE